MRSGRSFERPRQSTLGCFFVLSLAILASPAAAQTGPALNGQWDGPYDWAITPSNNDGEFGHACLLSVGPHAGKVLLWYFFDIGIQQSPRFFIFNPAAPQTLVEIIPNPPILANLFCSSCSFRADGKLVISGGVPVGGANANKSYLFDPVTVTFSPLGDMVHSRFYPTQIGVNVFPSGPQPAAAGDPIIIGGTVDFGG